MEKKPFVTKSQVEEIVKTYPTPFHLYDEKGIREKEIILLKVVEGKKNKEIAEQLNIAETTVKTQVQRAYRMLRERLVPIFLLIEYLQQGF